MFKRKIEFKKGVPGEKLPVIVLIVFMVLFVLIGKDWSTICFFLIAALLVLHRLFFGKLRLDPADLVLFWGLPGSGKTMMATKVAADNQRDWYIGVNPEFEHLSIRDFMYDRDSLAVYRFDGAALFFDEASLNGFDNREFKINFKDPGMLEMFKKHRQFDSPMVLTNQGFEECDIKIRQSLANKTYYCEDKGLYCRASLMIRTVTISELDGQPQEGYRFPTLLERFFDPSMQLYAWKSYYGKFYCTSNPPPRCVFPAYDHARQLRQVNRESNLSTRP